MAREETENMMRDLVLKVMAERMAEASAMRGEGNSTYFEVKPSLGGGTCRGEGVLDYQLPGGLSLSHKNDILFSLASGRYIALELKCLSAVTDQFKARCYDMLHLKQTLGTKVYGIMAYVHVPGTNGISIDRARAICYSFDYFLGIETRDIANLETWLPPIVRAVESVLTETHPPQTETQPRT